MVPLVQTNRIPTQGLKLELTDDSLVEYVGPNKQNPDSGIETRSSWRRSSTGSGSPNKQNPDSGIETTDFAVQLPDAMGSKQTESRLRD